MVFRVGVAQPWTFSGAARLIVAAEASHPSDNTESASLGAELELRRMLSLRAGYQRLGEQDSEVGPTLGAGLEGRLDTYSLSRGLRLGGPGSFRGHASHLAGRHVLIAPVTGVHSPCHHSLKTSIRRALIVTGLIALAATRARAETVDAMLDSLQATSFQYFWNEANPVERTDQGSRHADLAGQHRGDRVRPLGDLHRRGSRLGDPQRRAGARAHHAGDLLVRPAGDGGQRNHRLQGVLLPLPRHEHRHAHLEQRAVHHRHGAAAGRGARRADVFHDRRHGRGRDSRACGLDLPTRGLGVVTQFHARTHDGLAARPPDSRASAPGSDTTKPSIMYILALGSPTHPVGPYTWNTWVSGYSWQTQYGQTFIVFPPLFGHQYSQCWLDLRHANDNVQSPARHHVFRELAPRHAGAARVRDRESGALHRLQRHAVGPDRFRRSDRLQRARRAAGAERRRHHHAHGPDQLDRVRAGRGDPGDPQPVQRLQALPVVALRVPRCVQPDRGLVGHRCARDRPGTDHHDDRELPHAGGVVALHAERRHS